MALTEASKKLLELAKKYRAAILVVLVGIVLMCWPAGQNKENTEHENEEEVITTDYAKELEAILSRIQGAGKVELLLTVETGETMIYQTDQSGQTGDRKTVIVTDSDRDEQGLIQSVRSVRYRGAVVVCEGADDPVVKLAIAEAVANATGLSTDRISVLKMR